MHKGALIFMPRNAEMIRQWRVLREIEASHGVTIPHLATLTGVTTRTIRRDLDALQEAGFALYDQTVDGRKRWYLNRHPFKNWMRSGSPSASCRRCTSAGR